MDSSLKKNYIVLVYTLLSKNFLNKPFLNIILHYLAISC